MNTREPQYQRDLIAALDRLGVPESEHSCFRLSSEHKLFTSMDPPEWRFASTWTMHEGGMSEAIEKELRAAGLRPRMARSHSNESDTKKWRAG